MKHTTENILNVLKAKVSEIRAEMEIYPSDSYVAIGLRSARQAYMTSILVIEDEIFFNGIKNAISKEFLA